jgi:hypothetical protein
MNQFVFKIEGFQASAYRDQLEQLEQRFTNFWASVSYPTRLITFTRRFSFAPKRQMLRNSTNPLDDVRDLIGWISQALESADQQPLQAFVHKRSASLQRALATLHDAEAAADLLSLAGYGEAAPDELAALKEACGRAIWRWRWLVNYRRQYELLEQDDPPLGIHHYFLCWPEGYTEPDAIRAVLKGTFLLPNVEQRPLPALFNGRYRAEATYLAPLDEGEPYLRVLHAYDVRGDWNIASLSGLLNHDAEIAICQDIATLSKLKAEQATTNAFNVLREAIYGKHAIKDARSERAYRDVDYAMSQLDIQNMHEIAYALLIRAPNLRNLERQTQTIRDLLGARMRLDILAGAQDEYIKLFTATPSKQIATPLIRRNGLSENIAAKTMWGTVKSDGIDGIMWGYDQFEGMPVHYDLVGAAGTDNGHFMMLGQSGSGKTVALSTLALRLAVDGYQVVFFDPVGKCEWLCEAVGGGAVYNEVHTSAAINILDPIDSDISRQMGHVTRKLNIILGRIIQEGGNIRYVPRELSNFEIGALDIALRDDRIYGPVGQRLRGMSASDAPLLSDLAAVLDGVPVVGARDLAQEIRLIATGIRGHIYNARTSIRWDFSSDVCAYNFKGADVELLPLYYDHGFSTLDHYVRSTERKRRNQPLVVIIDEYGFMAQIRALHAFVAFATKTWRNFQACMGTCDQNAQTYMGGDGNSNDFAALTTNNTAVKFFGRQQGSDIDLLEGPYGHLLSPQDFEAMRSSTEGEFIAIFNNHVHHLKIELTNEERPYFIRRHT